MRRLLLIALVACQREPLPAEPKPAPGALLTAAPPPLAPTVRTRRSEPLDLGADRAPIEVQVPELPRGGTAPLELEGRNGWARRIPESARLPALAFGDGKIFASGGFESRSYYALDAKSGEQLWAATNLADNGPTAAVYEEGDLIFNTESCTLFVADAKTGKVRWSRYLGDPTLAQTAVADGLVFSSYPEAGAQRLGAFRVKDGRRIWSRAIAGELLAAPVIAGDSVYVSTLTGVTHRFERASGRRIWQKRLRATTPPWIAGSELFMTVRRGRSEQQVVVSADTGEILRAHHAASGTLRDLPVDLAAWNAVWAYEGSRPAVIDGVRYEAMAGEVRATDPQSGDVIWHRRYSVGDRSVGAVAVAGAEVVVATHDGKLFGLDVDTGYTTWAFDTKHPIAAQPIVAAGWVYAATTDGYVIAIELGDTTLDGWHMFGGNGRHNGISASPSAPPSSRQSTVDS